MKKNFLLLMSAVILASTVYSVDAASFEEGFKNINTKPLLLYITAPWVDDVESYETVYTEAEKNLSGLYNVAKLDVTTPDFKLFNETFHLYPKLPYVLLFKDGFKITRYLQKDCINNYSCVEEKAKSFLN